MAATVIPTSLSEALICNLGTEAVVNLTVGESFPVALRPVKEGIATAVEVTVAIVCLCWEVSDGDGDEVGVLKLVELCFVWFVFDVMIR